VGPADLGSADRDRSIGASGRLRKQQQQFGFDVSAARIDVEWRGVDYDV
jgi:hypothetical protein